MTALQKRAIPVLVYLFSSTLALASSDASNSLISPVSKTAKLNEIVGIKPIDTHHFNTKAPHSCGQGIQVEFTSRIIKCQFTKEGRQDLLVGVCDDKESFCKIEKFFIEVGSGQKSVKSVSTAPTVVEKQIDGFITNNSAKAIELAKAQHKLLLIDMYADWCPPCHELEEFVFVDPAFSKATKNFVKLRIDNDLPSAWEWNERFKISGIPTMLVIDPATLEEIGRTVGYHPVTAIAAWLSVQEKLKNKSIAWAMKQKTEPEKIRVARWYWQRGQNDLALEHLKDTRSKEAKLLQKMILKDVAWDQVNHVQYQNHLKELIEQFPDNIRVGQWVRDLLEADLSQGKLYVDRALASLDRWRKSKELSNMYEVDYDKADLFAVEGEIFHLLGDQQKSKQAYLQASHQLEEQAKRSSYKVSKGMNLVRASYLEDAELPEEAEKIFKTLVDAYPDEFIFNYRYARVLNDLHRSKEAMQYAEKARSQSYGDNQLRIIAVEAKIMADMGDKARAKQLIETTLDQINLPANAHAWTHGRIQVLRDLQKKIQE